PCAPASTRRKKSFKPPWTKSLSFVKSIPNLHATSARPAISAPASPPPSAPKVPTSAASKSGSISPTPRAASETLQTAASFHGQTEQRSEEHTSELQSRFDLVCRLLLEKKKNRSLRLIPLNSKPSLGVDARRCTRALLIPLHPHDQNVYLYNLGLLMHICHTLYHPLTTN